MAKQITIDEEIAEVKREIGIRERFYPEWTSGPKPKLKPAVAAQQLACMKAVLVRLERIKAETGVQTALF